MKMKKGQQIRVWRGPYTGITGTVVMVNRTEVAIRNHREVVIVSRDDTWRGEARNSP